MKSIHKKLLLKILFKNGARLISIGMPSLMLNLPYDIFGSGGYKTGQYPSRMIDILSTGGWSENGYILYKIRNSGRVKKYDFAYINPQTKELQTNTELLYYLLIFMGIKCQLIKPFPRSWYVRDVFLVDKISEIPKRRPVVYWAKPGMSISEWPVIYTPHNTVSYSVYVIEPSHFKEVVDRLRRYKIQFSVYNGHLRKDIIL